jgi:hypothetical protein
MDDEAARGGLTIQLYQQHGFGCSEGAKPGFRRETGQLRSDQNGLEAMPITRDP